MSQRSGAAAPGSANNASALSSSTTSALTTPGNVDSPGQSFPSPPPATASGSLPPLRLALRPSTVPSRVSVPFCDVLCSPVLCSDADEPSTALPLLLGCSGFSKAFLDANSAVVALLPTASSSSSLIPPLSVALSAPFSSPHCTFTATGFRHAYQLWRPCYTCNLIDSNGACQVCASTCHAGHDLGEERLSNFFCDCGSRGPSFCQALEEHSGHSPAPPAAVSASHSFLSSTMSPLTTQGGHWTGRSSSHVGLSGALLFPESALDLSGGLFAGSPPVDLAVVVKSVLSTNAQLFQSDSLQSLSATIREAAVLMHARERVRRSRKREKTQRTTQGDRPMERRRRGESFALSAFAACVEEMREDEDHQEAVDAASSPILQAVSHFLSRQSPYSMRLPSSQRRHFDLLLRRYCYSTFSRSPSSTSSSSSSAADSALRLWLTVGGVSERLEAALFLVELHAAAASLSPSISSFIASFVNEGRRRQRRILRTSRSSHMSELSSRAVRMSIDLICSSLALTPPVPTLSAASLASATASSHVSSGSVAQTTGVFPSLASSTKGDFLFFLSASYGLVKVGTGRSSVVGELIEQNPWLTLHAGGHLVCLCEEPSDTDSGEGGDVLLLRSPLLPSHRLLRIDCSTLQVTGSMSLSSTDVDAEPTYGFELEHELVSSTPSASTTPHWRPLAPVLMTSTDFISLSSNAYGVIQQCLASSQWKLGEPFSLSNIVSLVVVAAGVFLVIDQGQQPPIHYRLRLRAQKRPMPLLPDQRQAQRNNTPPSRFITFTDSTPVRVQTFSRRALAESKEVEVNCSCDWHVVEEFPMEDYHHQLPSPQPLLPTIAASTISTPSSGPPTSPSRPCDGCGLFDWRTEEEFTCLDGCGGLSLCSWCHLHQRFNTPSHSSHHHMDHYLPPPPPEPVNSSSPGLLRSELAGGVVYWDGARIVVFPPRLPSSTLRHWRDFAAGDIVDVKDLYQKWSSSHSHSLRAESRHAPATSASAWKCPALLTVYCLPLLVGCSLPSRRYQADILAVNPVEKTVMVHYHGWHQKVHFSPALPSTPSLRVPSVLTDHFVVGWCCVSVYAGVGMSVG